LFEKDKLLFSFLLSTRILEFYGKLNAEEFRFLLTGGISLSDDYPPIPDSCSSWMSPKSWGEICRLNDVEGLEMIKVKVSETPEVWNEIAHSEHPDTISIPIEGLTDF